MTIQQSESLSCMCSVKNAQVTGVWVPVVDSCNLLLRGSFDQRTEHTVPLYDTMLTDKQNSNAHDTLFRFACAQGSAGIAVRDDMIAFPYIRLETSVPQSDVRTLMVIAHMG